MFKQATPSSVNPKTWVPNDLMIEYYTARSSPGGLLISEACPVSLLAASTPGIREPLSFVFDYD